MKNILVPIDFSDASFNTISYAAFLANAFKAGLTLVHAYTDTSAFDEGPENKVYNSMEELEAANEKFLKKMMEEFSKKFTVKIEYAVRKGNPIKVINEIARQTETQLIIMGMKGKGKSNSIFGSTTTAIIDKTDIPLLAVPFKAGYQTIDTITLASDLKNEKLLSHFTILEKLIAKFNPFIQVLNIRKNNSKLSAEMIAGKMSKDLTWDKYNHSFNIIERDDIEEGIFRFLRKHPTDLLIMVARKRGFINKIFNPSHTKKMTDLTKIPLLILHE